MSQANGLREAEHVYVLMTDKYRISRNMRANWYLRHLNSSVQVQARQHLSEFTKEIDIISVTPSNYQELTDWGTENCLDPYFISANTKITFFARRYRLAFVLDLSPSVSSVDIQHKDILLDEVFAVLERSLQGLAYPFYVPDSQFLFHPEIYVTIIAHIPFHCYEGHQVVAQGWKLTSDNVDSFLNLIQTRLLVIANEVSEVIAKANEECDNNLSENDVLIGSFFEENENKKFLSTLSMTSPDISTVNMLRFGLLSLQLLPQNSTAGIVIITDGMISLPSANVLDSVLTQLRHHTISCSFLQVGSNPHPHSCFGFVPNIDLMKFISTATFGAYLSFCPKVEPQDGLINHFNIYHRAFFAWNFQRGLFGFRSDINHHNMRSLNEWSIENPYFYSMHDQANLSLFYARETPDQQIVRNKQMESTINSPLNQILSCRLREGYTIKSVNFNKNESQIEIKLIIPWRFNVHIEYLITSAWPPAYNSHDLEHSQCHYEVFIEGSYNFLHDVTCASKRIIKSPYRAATVKQFWATLKTLAESDKLEAHLNDFSLNPFWQNIPESIKNGVPLFYMPPIANDPVVSSKNAAHFNFSQYWKQICMLDITIWQKWMHTHRINIILEHDMPLPKHLHLPNATGRYMHIQCRQALSSLSDLLKLNTDFILLENHSYIKLLNNQSNESSNSFFMVRITSQPPSITIHLAFIGGTSGHLRHQIVTSLKEKIKNLKFPKRNMIENRKPNDIIGLEAKSPPSPLQREWINVNCCIIMEKPIDKIMIRYEKSPIDFSIPNISEFAQIYNTSDTQSNASTITANLSSSSVFDTLRRYLHHERWIWNTQYSHGYRLPQVALARILGILTKKRLQQDFHFVYNNSGIINMALELTMQDDSDHQFPCLVQYIIFPPHKHVQKECQLDDYELEVSEDDGEYQLVTECYVEPQQGYIVKCSQWNRFLENLSYKEITKAFYPIDLDTISSLLSYEHILMMCQSNDVPSLISGSIHQFSSTQCHNSRPTRRKSFCSDDDYMNSTNKKFESNIHSVPFCFDLIKLLQKCQHAEILFSTLFQQCNYHSNQSNDFVNEILFELFLSNLLLLHDREIINYQLDFVDVIKLIYERKSETKTNYRISQLVLKQFNIVPSSLKCYCKALTINSIVITIVPASYKDLLILTKNELIDGKANLINSGISNEYGTLSLPIFIFKCSLNALNEQLVYLKNDKKRKDLQINHTYTSAARCHLNSMKLLHRRATISEFQVHESQTMNISLKNFCKLIESIYWKTFSHAIYKAVQLSYSIDKLDIALLIEKAFHESFKEVEINKFMKFIYKESKEFFSKYYYLSNKFFTVDNLENIDMSLRRVGFVIPIPRIKVFSSLHLSMKLYSFIVIHRDFYDKLKLNQLSNQVWFNSLKDFIKVPNSESFLNLKHERDIQNFIKLLSGTFGLVIEKGKKDKAIDLSNHISVIEDKSVCNDYTNESRRIYLWEKLFSKETSSTNLPITFNEFNELLNLITLIPLDQYDHLLTPFVGLHISWYQGLIKTLITKYNLFHLNFYSSDGKNIKMVFTHHGCVDCFVLLSIDTNISNTEINLAFNKPSGLQSSKPIFQDMNFHSLVEDFINGCAYFMWTTII